MVLAKTLTSFAFVTRKRKVLHPRERQCRKCTNKGNLSRNIAITCIRRIDNYYIIIMISKITPVKAIQFTKISVVLACAWPPSPKTTKFGIIIFKTWWYTCYFSNILLLLPLLNSIYEYRENPVILAKSVCLFCAVLQVIIKMIICRIQYTRFQVRI